MLTDRIFLREVSAFLGVSVGIFSRLAFSTLNWVRPMSIYPLPSLTGKVHGGVYPRMYVRQCVYKRLVRAEVGEKEERSKIGGQERRFSKGRDMLLPYQTGFYKIALNGARICNG